MKRIICIILVIMLLVTGSAFAEKGKSIWGKVGDWTSNVWNDTKDLAGDTWDSVSDWTSNAWDDTKEFAGDTWDSISDWTSNAWSSVSGWTSSAWDATKGFTVNAWDTASGAVVKAWNGTTEKIKGIWNDETGEFIPEEDKKEIQAADDNIQRMYLGTLVKTGTDTGYTEESEIKFGDPHYGWELGRFYVAGYTRIMAEGDGDPIILKTVGDKIELHFLLNADIDNLNGVSGQMINEDNNGYDEHFSTPKTNFGRGTMIVRKTDYQNNAETPVIYTDFLSAVINGQADTVVQVFEEGDYEVALDYEIKTPGIIPKYTNYRIAFDFKVRNGNCMFYPFDIETGDELSDDAVTENGFMIDLARSRFLDIDVKYIEISEIENGYRADVRYNRPAQDGDEYIDDGVYIIMVKNRYTGSHTEKNIYVNVEEDIISAIENGLVKIPEDD